MRNTVLSRSMACALALALGSLALSREARATNAYEFPDTGTEQVGRGGAWVARASGPLATVQNPAGLAGQRTALSLDLNLIWQKTCFSRSGPGGAAEQVKTNGPTFSYPTSDVCNTNSGTPFPNPALAATIRVTPRLGIGIFLGGPSAAGKAEWPDTVTGTKANGQPTTVPAPTRYMLLSQEGLVLLPTVSVGYEVIPGLRLGAGFTWGVAHLKLSNVSRALSSSSDPYDQSSDDLKANLDVKDNFVPSVVAGALYSPTSNLDIGAWWHWSDDLRARGDVTVVGPIYNGQGVRDPSQYDCGNPGNAYPCTEVPGAAYLRIKQPMQAKLGVRFHQPLEGAGANQASLDGVAAPQFRDPIANDAWDIEADVTFSHNSAADALVIRFPPNGANQQPIYLPWLVGGAQVPPNADVPHQFRDVWGLRVGGDYAIVPKHAVVRGGAFVESRGQDPAYANIDFVPAARVGLSLGGTYRFGESVDVLFAASHIFAERLDNGGQGKLLGIAGSGTTAYRTATPINDGSVQQSVTIVSVGGAYRF